PRERGEEGRPQPFRLILLRWRLAKALARASFAPFTGRSARQGDEGRRRRLTHGLHDSAMTTRSAEEVGPVRREGIDQPAGFQRLDAVDEVGRHDEGVALIERFGPAVDGYLEAAFDDIARLHMRVRMQRADRAFRKGELDHHQRIDRKSTRLNSSHVKISYAVFCLKKKKTCIVVKA